MAEANGWTTSWGTRQTFWPEKGICIQTSLILNSVLKRHGTDKCQGSNALLELVHGLL